MLRAPVVAGLAACTVALVVVCLAATPYLLNATVLEHAIVDQVRTTAGLRMTAQGPARFSLLPQPHVEVSTVHLADTTDTLQVDADELRGEIRFLPLLVGRVEIAAATLERPRLTIELDGKTMPPDSTIGRALRPEGATRGSNQRLGVVTLVDGTAVLKSRSRPHDIAVEAVNVTIDWRNLDAPATLTGSVAFEGAATSVAAWVSQPAALLRGDHSAIAFRLHSTPLDLSANGEVSGFPTAHFHGRLQANAPTLGGVLALVGYEAALPASFADLAVTSDASAGDGVVDLSNLHLQLDGNAFEGTLDYRRDGLKPMLSGTLATDQLALAPFLTRAPTLLDDERRWSTHKLRPETYADIGLDLRISATHLRFPPLAIEDAALAIMTRNERTEITLVEGRVDGGAVKARASVEAVDDALSLRGTGTLTNADASAMSWDAFGRQIATGTVSASANFEGVGDSVATLARSLRGSAKLHATDGEISVVDFGRSLRDLSERPVTDGGVGLRRGRTAFDSALVALQLAEGVATIEKGTLRGPDAALTVAGKIDIGNRALDLALAAEPAVAQAGVPALRFSIDGTMDQASVNPIKSPPSLEAATPSSR